MPALLLTLLLALRPVPAAVPDTAAVLAAVEETLARQFPDDAHRLRIRVVRMGGDVVDGDVVDGDAGGALRVVLPAARLPEAHTQVKVLAGDDARGWHEAGWALLYVARYDSVVIARAAVRQGDPVAPADLSDAWIETTRFVGTPLRPADARALAAAGEVF